MVPSQPVDPRSRLRWEIDTVADRFRGLSEARLRAPARSAGAPSRRQTTAQRGIELAQRLADAAAGVAARSMAYPARAHVVPTISVFAVGEQVAVTGHELLAELAEVSDDDLVWAGDRRVKAIDLVISLNEELKRLRVAGL
jgi:hypothetical protein